MVGMERPAVHQGSVPRLRTRCHGSQGGRGSPGVRCGPTPAANQELQCVNAKLEEARREAELANRSKSEFLAAMSHEIRTPMNGAIGMLDVLNGSSLTGEQLEMVSLVRESADSLLTIINDILDFSKIEAGRLEIESLPLSVADVVEKACELLDRLAARKREAFSVFVDPAIPATVLGDAGRLRQILSTSAAMRSSSPVTCHVADRYRCVPCWSTRARPSHGRVSSHRQWHRHG